MNKKKIITLLISIICIILHSTGLLSLFIKNFFVYWGFSFILFSIPEMQIIMGLLFIFTGSLCLAWIIELVEIKSGKKLIYILLCFTGIPGFILLIKILLKADYKFFEKIKKPVKTGALSKISILLTGLFVLGFLFSFLFIIIDDINKNSKVTYSKEQRIDNERKTFSNLKSIISAQDKYIKKDWDGDNVLSYSQFLVHLWKTIDGQGNSKQLDYISKELGFAMGPSRSVDGYYFTDIYITQIDERNHDTVQIKPEKAYCITAHPAGYNRSGKLSFYITNPDKIFVKDTNGIIIREMPENPVFAGWKRIKSEADLIKIQKLIDYK